MTTENQDQEECLQLLAFLEGCVSLLKEDHQFLSEKNFEELGKNEERRHHVFEQHQAFVNHPEKYKDVFQRFTQDQREKAEALVQNMQHYQSLNQRLLETLQKEQNEMEKILQKKGHLHPNADTPYTRQGGRE